MPDQPGLLADPAAETNPTLAHTPGTDPALAVLPVTPVGPRYRLLEEIAHGGMGIVWRAADDALGREVAVKLLHERFATDSAAARRFADEARIAAQLQHPAIPPVHDLGVLPDGRPFQAMKLIKGATLAVLLAARPDPGHDRGRFVAVFEQVCQALAYAHAHGVIHRDLKPANIMVGAFGEVQVMDWGLAKVLAQRPAEADADPQQTAGGTEVHSLRDSDGTCTQAGSVLGTPAFMPPEQAVGALGKVDARSDVFGLGAILAVILTGEPPFAAASAETTRIWAAQGKVQGCFARLDGCGADPDLVALCKRCLAPDQADRPADAGEVAAAVAELRQAAEERARRAELDRVRTELQAAEQRKRRRVVGLAVGLLLLGGAAFGWWHTEQGRAARERHGRNAEAVAGLLDQCRQALRAGDAAGAAVILEAAQKRAAEGGADDLTAGLSQCEEDLAVLRDLDAIDQFRWSSVEGRFPQAPAVAARYREVLGRFDLDPDTTNVEQAAERVSASAVRDRLVAALDRMLGVQRSAGVRAALRAVDPDPFRDAVRDAVRTGSRELAQLAGKRSALEQPPWFAAFLGESDGVGLKRRRELLRAAAQRCPNDLAVLMALGNTYPLNRSDGAEERARWFQTAVGVAPANPTAHINLGIALRDKNDLEGAVVSFREAIRLAPRFAMAHHNLGTVLRDKNDPDGAIAEHREALRLHPGLVLAHSGLGNALMDKKDVDGALAEYRQAVRLDPGYAPGHNGLGNALRKKNNLEGAIAEYKEAIRLEPRFALPHIGLGITLRDKNNLEGAIAEYREAIRLDPSNVTAHNNLGTVLRDKKDLEGAFAEYKEAIRLDPRFAMAHIGLGNVLKEKKNLEGAIVEYREAVRLDPRNVMAHTNLGIALYEKKDLEGAIVEFREAIRLDPRFAIAHNSLGIALTDKKDVDGAIASFRQAIRFDPGFAWPHNNLGNALFARNDLEGAITEYREAIRLNPRFAPLHANLGNALRRKKDLEGAIAEYREAIRLDPRFAQAHYSLGNALKAGKDLEGAVACYRRALALAPEYAEAHCNLGHALQSQGRFAEALAALQRGHDLGRERPGWPYPSAAWLRDCRHLLELDGRLATVLAGKEKPKSPAEACELARLCGEPFQRRYADAARLSEDAFAADPKLADNLLQAYRYNAACYAARAARGDGRDAPVGEAERATLRGKALAWLRADLVLRREQAGSTVPALRQTAAAMLSYWLKDPDLSGLHPGSGRNELSPQERNARDALWADVKAALALAQKPSAAKPSK